MIHIVIPAREGSKGWPHKNRKLFQYTIDSIPDIKYICGEKIDINITTDDNIIKRLTEIEYSKKAAPVYLHERQNNLANDTANIKDVLLNISRKWAFDDIIIMLYLTYPQRTWGEIENAFEFYIKHGNGSSLLCRHELGYTPYLAAFEKGENGGELLFPHNQYRRQDYRKTFAISHYVFISHVRYLPELKKNLFNDKTIYFPIVKPIDVDSEENYKKFYKENFHL